MERIAMSRKERDDLDWLKRAKEGSISQREAAQKMGVIDRWVRTLLKRMTKQGDAVVVHGLRAHRALLLGRHCLWACRLQPLVQDRQAFFHQRIQFQQHLIQA